MKTILCDIDSTIANIMPVWLQKYNEDYGDALVPEDITHWGIHEIVKPECANKIFDYVLSPDFYQDVEPIDGAIESVNYLKSKYDVVFVTSGLQPAKIEWLVWHGLIDGRSWKFSKSFIVASRKDLIRGDFLIDDASHNCEDFKNGLPICFAQPWNVSYNGIRSDWEGILKWFQW